MYSIVSQTVPAAANVEEERTARLYRISQRRNHIQTDRLFAKLMVMQWLGGIVIAVWLSPMAWGGSSIQPLWHVWAAASLRPLCYWPGGGRGVW